MNTNYDNNGIEDPRLPELLDRALRERARSGSDLHALAAQVEARIMYRQQAEQWMRSHRGGLLRDHRRPTLRKVVAMRVGALVASGAWRIIGPVLLAAMIGYGLARFAPPMVLSPQVSTLLHSLGGLTAVGAVSMALIAGLAMQWTRMRQYYF